MKLTDLEYYLFNKIDRTLFGLIIMLIVAGLVILASANQQDISHIMSQTMNISVGLGFLYLICHTKTRLLLIFSPWLYMISILLLLFVDLFGVQSHGSQRWVDLGVFNLQPSETLKITLPLMLAWVYQKNNNKIGYRVHFVSALLISIPFYLVLIQPDLGTSLLILWSGLVIIILAGLPIKFIIVSFTGLLLSLPVIWSSLLEYQKNRVLNLIDPYNDPLGAGYHSIQSMIAVGSGGLAGRGWSNGTQTRLDFLPETTTDFIFAVFSEEFGFLGVICILVLFVLIFYRCMWMASKMQDTFSRLLTAGLTVSLFTGVIVNIGMISGLLPIVGVPLPFISYGGTSMVVSLISMGIIMNLYSNKSLIAN